jgi:hypothetical protein
LYTLSVAPLRDVVIAALFACIGGCKANPAAVAIDRDALVGDWEFWCTTESATDATCRGKDPSGDHEVFKPDGTVEWWDRDRFDTRSTSDWTLTGDVLSIRYRNAGASEAVTVRIVDRALVLWDAQHRTSRIYARRGERLKLAPSIVATGDPITRELAGVRYGLTVPKGYRLGLVESDRERWEPEQDGFVYTVVVGGWPGGPCPPERATLDAASAQGWGGEHAFGVGTSLCIRGTSLDVSCDAGSTRGYLEKSEERAAVAVCNTLTAAAL